MTIAENIAFGASCPSMGRTVVTRDDIVAAARANGAPVEYLVFEDEGHNFRKKENRLAAYRAILGFLDTLLKAPDTAARGAVVDNGY